MIELNDQETSLLIQAISLARLSSDFSVEEQMVLKQVAERLDGRVPNGDCNGSKEGNSKSGESMPKEERESGFTSN